MSDHDIDAALMAAGALTAPERDALSQKLLTDPAFAQAVADWESALAPIAGILPSVEPPADLLGKIEARLDDRAKLAELNLTVRASDGVWQDMGPGIRFKVLHHNPARQRQTILLVAEAGARHPAHVHDSDEEVFMISGDLTIDGEELGPGDFHFSPKGSHHPEESTREGCRCVIMVEI